MCQACMICVCSAHGTSKGNTHTGRRTHDRIYDPMENALVRYTTHTPQWTSLCARLASDARAHPNTYIMSTLPPPSPAPPPAPSTPSSSQSYRRATPHRDAMFSVFTNTRSTPPSERVAFRMPSLRHRTPSREAALLGLTAVGTESDTASAHMPRCTPL